MYTRGDNKHRAVKKNICLPLIVSIIVTLGTGITALADDAVIGFIPWVEKPGTEITYTDLSSVSGIEDGFEEPNKVIVPDEVPRDVRDYIASEDSVVLNNFENRIPIGYYASVIYPNMKVVYDEETGDINNIYYYSEEDEEYFIHNNNYNEEMEAALQKRVEGNQIPKGNDSVKVIVSEGRVSTSSIGTRNQDYKEGDCLLGGDSPYKKLGEHDIAVRNLTYGNSSIFYYDKGVNFRDGATLASEADAVKFSVNLSSSYPTKLRVMFIK